MLLLEGPGRRVLRGDTSKFQTHSSELQPALCSSLGARNCTARAPRIPLPCIFLFSLIPACSWWIRILQMSFQFLSPTVAEPQHLHIFHSSCGIRSWPPRNSSKSWVGFKDCHGFMVFHWCYLWQGPFQPKLFYCGSKILWLCQTGSWMLGGYFHADWKSNVCTWSWLWDSIPRKVFFHFHLEKMKTRIGTEKRIFGLFPKKFIKNKLPGKLIPCEEGRKAASWEVTDTSPAMQVTADVPGDI